MYRFRAGDKNLAVRRSINKTSSRVFQVIKSGVVFEFQPEPEGGYTVTVPSLPGCISYGETFERAMDMIKDAASGWLVVAKEEGIPIPDQFEDLVVANL